MSINAAVNGHLWGSQVIITEMASNNYYSCGEKFNSNIGGRLEVHGFTMIASQVDALFQRWIASKQVLMGALQVGHLEI